MTIAVRISDELADNSYLTYEFIKDLLLSIEELDSGKKSEFKFG